jgi:hypothetical protein
VVSSSYFLRLKFSEIPFVKILVGCSKRFRFKAPDVLRSESYKKYVEAKRDEGNAEDGPVLTTHKKRRIPCRNH